MTRQAGKILGWYRRSSSQRSCGIRYPGLYPAIPSSLRLFHLHNYSTNTNTHSGSKLLGINEFIDLRRSFFCLFTSSMATSHENSTHVATSHKLRRVPLPAIQSTARPSRPEALCKLFVGCRQSQNFPSSPPLAID